MGLLDHIIDAVFGAVAKGKISSELDKLSQKDPEFGEQLKDLMQMRKEMRKRLKNMSKSEKERLAKRFPGVF